MDAGQSLRWHRFHTTPTGADGGSGHSLIVPIDHGLTLGPIEGIQSVRTMARWITHPAISGLVAHKGMARRLAEHGLMAGKGMMIHLNGMSSLAPTPDRKEMLTEVESAVRLGADAVSLQVNFDGPSDGHNLQMLGQVVDAAQRYGLPVLTMLYDKVPSGDRDSARARLRQLMRAAVELGTDAIKIGAPDPLDELHALLEGTADDVAVYVAGGEVGSEDAVVRLARTARAAGAAGLCVGRNVFGRPDPGPLLESMGEALDGGRDARVNGSVRLADPVGGGVR